MLHSRVSHGSHTYYRQVSMNLFILEVLGVHILRVLAFAAEGIRHLIHLSAAAFNLQPAIKENLCFSVDLL